VQQLSGLPTTASLSELPWLPAHFIIIFKLPCVTYKVCSYRSSCLFVYVIALLWSSSNNLFY